MSNFNDINIRSKNVIKMPPKAGSITRIFYCECGMEI